MIRLSTGAAFGVAVAAAVATPLASASAAQQAATPSADTRPAVAAEQAQGRPPATGHGPVRRREAHRARCRRRRRRHPPRPLRPHVQGPARPRRGLRRPQGRRGQTRRVYWNGSGAVAVTSTSPRVAETSAEQSAARRAGYTPRGNDGELVVWRGGAPRLAWDVVTTGTRADQTPAACTPSWTRTAAPSSAPTTRSRPGPATRCTRARSRSTRSPPARAGCSRTPSATTRPTSTAPPRDGTQFTDADNVWGKRVDDSRQTAGVDAGTAPRRRSRYYKNVQGRNGIWNNGTGARSRTHYGNAYNNAFWGRHADDLWRRRQQCQAAHLDRRRGPRDEPRRHREHCRAELLRGRGRPERGDLRHLRHLRRVLRQQQHGRRRLPHRREDRHQRQRHAAALHGQAQQGRTLPGLLDDRHSRSRPALLLGSAEPLVLPRL